MRTTVLARQSRQGTYTSPSVVVPSGLTYTKIEFDLPEAELTSSRTFHCDVQFSADNGQSWQKWFGCGKLTDPCVPNEETGLYEPPFIQFDPSAFIGQRIRVQLAVPTAMVMGAIIETG